MTKGEYRVGINFNPSNDDMVGQIKRLAADLIDKIESIPLPEMEEKDGEVYFTDWAEGVGELIRLKALAATAVEDGAMWAVKAATKKANT